MDKQGFELALKQYVADHTQDMFAVLKDLCGIPAPSHFEHKRAEYCKKWLENAGAKGVYMDEALNVIFPLNCEGSNELTVFVAHTDTVFPDLEPLPYSEDEENIYCPGVGDDTISVVVLMFMAKFFIENNLKPDKGMLFVCNSCEEGLGDLKGTRQLFRDFEGRIKQFISFDSNLQYISDDCAGSHRYEVEVLTEGGHSFQAFGKPNANAILGEMIANIYKLEVPKKEGTKTTYNVGTISGGTSVNTIAQNAKMLCEYRSDNKDCLAEMKAKFETVFEAARGEGVTVNVTQVGNRPCSDIAPEKIDALKAVIGPVIESVIGMPVICKCSSTDCNIPLSLGIPALNIGVNNHFGTHTRQEYLVKNTVPVGLEVAIRVSTTLGEVIQ